MIWLVILVIILIGFLFMCIGKAQTVTRKERERRNIIDEMELHELLEHYKDFDDFD